MTTTVEWTVTPVIRPTIVIHRMTSRAMTDDIELDESEGPDEQPDDPKQDDVPDVATDEVPE